MQIVTAVISCEPGETNVTTPSDINSCRMDLQTACGRQGRVVSKLEICQGCCQVLLPCPVKPPVKWSQCAATNTDKTFRPTGVKRDCHICARVGDQFCGFQGDTVFLGLACTHGRSQGQTHYGVLHKPTNIFVAFQLGSRDCSSCSPECQKKRLGMAISMVLIQCREGPPRKCKCCCTESNAAAASGGPMRVQRGDSCPP
ncbi:hypothetical protein MKW94_018463 [Papaver nudicaule]|uniref:Uncharacterized protein n=1 Tax=Papaver nudicaule TaxID=74823 RepID=A0AA42B427_PAPNU|nr:hypothetical protein [Papaver nudicaule]